MSEQQIRSLADLPAATGTDNIAEAFIWIENALELDFDLFEESGGVIRMWNRGVYIDRPMTLNELLDYLAELERELIEEMENESEDDD